VVRLLLDRRANVNLASAGDGSTALVHALRSNNSEAAKLPLAREANAKVRSAWLNYPSGVPAGNPDPVYVAVRCRFSATVI
jgi:hypothetical protein